MKVIHTHIRDEKHLQGLTEEEKVFIRRFAKLTANIILEDHEKSIRLSPNIKR